MLNSSTTSCSEAPGVRRGVLRAAGIVAWLAVAATVCLIFLGGMVTTRDAGMAFPDWPLSNGSINPPGWIHIEGQRLEHGHRLLASAVGLITILLAVLVWRGRASRGIHGLALAAVVGVIAQGIMGGLRVTENSTTWAIIHGCVAQGFLVMLVILALGLTVRTRVTVEAPASGFARELARALIGLLAFGALLFVQLAVAATMRHLKAGMVIPDFPLAFGKVIPALDSFPVTIHYAHRVLAGVILVGVVVLWFSTRPVRERNRMFAGCMLTVCTLVAVQIVLGAFTIWTGRNPWITTLHVLNGAAVLGFTAAAHFGLFRLVVVPKDPAGNPSASERSGGNTRIPLFLPTQEAR